MSAAARPKSITAYALQKAAAEGKFINIKTASALTINGAEASIKKNNKVYIADPNWPVAGTWDEIHAFFAARQVPQSVYGNFLRYDSQTLSMPDIRQRFDASVAQSRALRPRKTQQEIQQARRAGSIRNTNKLAEWARILSVSTVKCEPHIRPRGEVQVRVRAGRTRTGPVSWTAQYGEVLAERQQKPTTHGNYVIDVTNLRPHAGSNPRTKTFGIKAIRKAHYQGGTKFALPDIHIMSTNFESYHAFLQMLLAENANFFGGRSADQIAQAWRQQKPAVTTRSTVRNVSVMPTAMPVGQIPQMPSIPAGGLTSGPGVQRVASPTQQAFPVQQQFVSQGPSSVRVSSVPQPPASPRVMQTGFTTSAPMSANFMNQSMPSMPQAGSPGMMAGPGSSQSQGFGGAF